MAEDVGRKGIGAVLIALLVVGLAVVIDEIRDEGIRTFALHRL